MINNVKLIDIPSVPHRFNFIKANLSAFLLLKFYLNNNTV